MKTLSLKYSSFKRVSFFILAVLVAQFATAFKLTCLPKSLSFVPNSLRFACDPVLYPFLAYPMYSAARYPGDTHEDRELFGVLENGQQVLINEKSLGIGLYEFNSTYLHSLSQGKTDKIQDIVARYIDKKGERLTHLILKTYPILQTENDLQKQPEIVKDFPVSRFAIAD